MANDMRGPPGGSPSEDPFAAMFRAAAEETARRQREHEELRKSPEFVQQTGRLERLTYDFCQTLRVCWLASTRNAEFSENSFFLRNTEHLTQSALMTAFATREGFLNPGRRELRFLLELAVQALYTDEQMGKATFDEMREFFKRKVDNSSVSHVKELRLFLIPARIEDFRKHVVAAWADASAFVHPSPRQLDERVRLAEKGIALGFETIDQLRAAVDEVARALGIVVTLAFHAIGPSFTADVLVDSIDGVDAWAFHRDPFVAEVDAYFDYKHERQSRLAEVQERRRRRLEHKA